MGRFTVSVDVEAATKETARRLLTEHGLTVTRVTERKATTPLAGSKMTTPPNPFTRASAALDMPEELDRYEQRAYVRGYALGCHRFVKKHGGPVIRAPRHYSPPDEDGYRAPSISDDEVKRLHVLTREHEWERHPVAHKAGLAELARYQQIHPHEHNRRAVA